MAPSRFAAQLLPRVARPAAEADTLLEDIRAAREQPTGAMRLSASYPRRAALRRPAGRGAQGRRHCGPVARGQIMMNFSIKSRPEWAVVSYLGNLARLQHIKQRQDPDKVLSSNVNIPPRA